MPDHDQIAGNHIIDDLMSFRYCAENGLDYNRMRPDVSYSRLVWDGICKRPERWEEYAMETLKSVSRKLPPGGHFLLSQYPSKFEQLHGFTHETEVCTKVFEMVADSLSGDGFYDESRKVSGVFENAKIQHFSPSNWAVLRKR